MILNHMRRKNEGGVYRNVSRFKRILVPFETVLVGLWTIGNTDIPDAAMPQRNEVFNSQARSPHIITGNEMHVLSRILFIDDHNGNFTTLKEAGRAIK